MMRVLDRLKARPRAARATAIGALWLAAGMAGGCSLDATPSAHQAESVRPAASVTTEVTTTTVLPSTTTEAPSTTESTTASLISSTTTTEFNPPTTPYVNPNSCQAAHDYLDPVVPEGTIIICPATYAQTLGHEAMTCVNNQQYCPNEKVIALAKVCVEAYTNEGYNIWAVINKYHFMTTTTSSTSLPPASLGPSKGVPPGTAEVTTSTAPPTQVEMPYPGVLVIDLHGDCEHPTGY